MKEIGRFQTKSDRGKIYTIIEYQEYVSSGVDNSKIPTQRRRFTSEGLTVTSQNDPNTFKIVETNEIVRKF
jgi:hypothetical protein